MGPSGKAVLQFLIVGCFFAGLIVCIFTESNFTGWALRLTSPAIAVGISFVLWRISRREEKLPDLLQTIDHRYFECDGLCFMPKLDTIGGLCRINLYYQNRYERPCKGEVAIDPPARFLWGRLPISSATITVDCDGGEFGVAQVFYPVQPHEQGQAVTFDISARTRYPNRRGRLLRFREGIHVGPRRSATPTALRIAVAFAGIHLSSAARATFTLPTHVADTLPPDLKPSQKALWRPGDPSPATPDVDQRRRAA